MGSLGLCQYGCTGISIEHMTIDGQGLLVNAIYNGYAGDQSYVNDVPLKGMALNGLFIAAVSGSGPPPASNSGPYSNIAFTSAPNALCFSPGNCPACVQLQVQTRGLRDFTCIGNPNTSVSTGTGPRGVAAIYVNASNNSIEDVHIESFWDGVEIGGTTSAPIGNVLLSNVDGATKGDNGNCDNGNPTEPIVNLIHLCGLNVPTGRMACLLTTAPVSDVTILGAKLQNGYGTSAVIEDDLADTAITLPNAGNLFTVGFYALGEQVTGTGTTLGYSRITSSAASAEGNPPGTMISVPTWGIGNGPPNSPCNAGTIYSNTAPAGPYTLYVCTSSGSWAHIA